MKHVLDFRGLDVKHLIALFEERGQSLPHLRQRCQDLSARLTPEARHDSPEWQELEREVLLHEDEQSAQEPNALEEIRAARPPGAADQPDRRDVPPDLADRLAGAWYGRIAGCVLGKPVESLMQEGDRGCRSRSTQKQILQANGDYPLSDYLSEKVMFPYWRGVIKDPSWFEKEHARESLREHLRYAPRDDDVDYTVLGLRQVEVLGRTFTPEQSIAACRRISPDWFEQFRCCRLIDIGLHPPTTATFLNPYREWIGAQIRTDIFGYICPGRPAEAAALAWADSIKDHSRNGLYGAMWVSACVAAAFVERDPVRILEAGLAQVPASSRLALHLRRTMEVATQNGADYEATFDDIAARLGTYHPIHAINNACVVVAALLHGGGDYSRTIGIAVMGGLDTDCNGATAGSILGTALGRAGIPDRWIAPFKGRVRTGVNHEGALLNRLPGGVYELSIERLIQATVAVAAV